MSEFNIMQKRVELHLKGISNDLEMVDNAILNNIPIELKSFFSYQDEILNDFDKLIVDDKKVLKKVLKMAKKYEDERLFLLISTYIKNNEKNKPNSFIKSFIYS